MYCVERPINVISPPMKVGPPRGKGRKVASVASATRTSARLKVMNKSGKDEHPVTKGSKTSGRGGGKGKKGKREKGKKGKRLNNHWTLYLFLIISLRLVWFQE